MTHPVLVMFSSNRMLSSMNMSRPQGWFLRRSVSLLGAKLVSSLSVQTF